MNPASFAVRYIIDRYGVSPSLARTIAALAMSGRSLMDSISFLKARIGAETKEFKGRVAWALNQLLTAGDFAVPRSTIRRPAGAMRYSSSVEMALKSRQSPKSMVVPMPATIPGMSCVPQSRSSKCGRRRDGSVRLESETPTPSLPHEPRTAVYGGSQGRWRGAPGKGRPTKRKIPSWSSLRKVRWRPHGR